MTNEKRLGWIDIAKGIGIMLVVLGHTIVPGLREKYDVANFLWTFIYSFHMPLFFFLSGYLFEHGLKRYADKKRFLLSKARKLLLPYLFFSVFAYVFIALALKVSKLAVILQDGGYTASSVIQALLGILSYHEHIDKHIWFCYALFVSFLLNIFLPKAMKHPAGLTVQLLLCLSTHFIGYFGILSHIARNLFFFSLARLYLDRESIRERFQKIPFSVVSLAFFGINLIYTALTLSSVALSAVLAVFWVTAAVLGIATVCGLSSALIQFQKTAALLSYLGNRSYDIYLMHAPFLVSGLVGILLYYSTLPAYLICAIVFVLGITLPLLVSNLFVRRIPMLNTIILGEKYKKS